jgi:hypothetical protein
MVNFSHLAIENRQIKSDKPQTTETKADVPGHKANITHTWAQPTPGQRIKWENNEPKRGVTHALSSEPKPSHQTAEHKLIKIGKFLINIAFQRFFTIALTRSYCAGLCCFIFAES